MSFAEWWNLVKRNRKDYPGRMYAKDGRIRKGRKPLRRRSGR